MAITKLVFTFSMLFVIVQHISGHGRMTKPVHRGGLWRTHKYSDVEPNYSDNENFCGGREFQDQHQGKCGVCGDAITDPIPRKNENGGIYGKGYVVETYQTGEKINVEIQLTASHLGHFKFSICKLSSPTAVETEECFDQYPLEVINEMGQKGLKYNIYDAQPKMYSIDVLLPQSLKCDRCVLRWHYEGANNWGYCDEAKTYGNNGCGAQEHFRNCADISIV